MMQDGCGTGKQVLISHQTLPGKVLWATSGNRLIQAKYFTIFGTEYGNTGGFIIHHGNS